jgi:hypothetical protein
MKRFTPLILLAITFASCTHVYYAPNTANAPMLSEKGETRINGLRTGGNKSEFSGGELQAAHAITNSFGVMANWMSVSKTEEISDWTWNSGSHIEKGNGSYVEFAGGYFKTLDKRKRVVFETYGGIGFGSANNDYGFAITQKLILPKFSCSPPSGTSPPISKSPLFLRSAL